MSPVDYPHREESSPDRENAGGCQVVVRWLSSGWQVVAGRRSGGGRPAPTGSLLLVETNHVALTMAGSEVNAELKWNLTEGIEVFTFHLLFQCRGNTPDS